MDHWIKQNRTYLPLSSIAGAILLMAALLLLVDGRSTTAQGIVHYVTSNGVTSGACGSWATACTLDFAMSHTVAGDELWLKSGVYTPTVGVGTTSSFTLTSGVGLYGGFAGTESARAQRNPAANVVVLSGDVGVPGDANDNSTHVVTAVNVNASTVVDALTIRNGNAQGYGSLGNGGGMFIQYGNLTVANVIFTNNTANQYGGGLYSRYGAPTLQNVQFLTNTANYGGGVTNYGPVMTITNATFRGNSALNGGGLYNNSSNSVLTNVVFENNSGSYGGGLYSNNSTTSITTTQFISNAASGYGGAIYLSKNELWLADAVLASNTSRMHGGALYVYRGAFTGVRLSLMGNSARYNGGAVFTDRSALTMTNVAATYNQGKYGGIFYNDTTTVTLTNATFYSNTATVDGGALFNDGSPATIDHLTAVSNNADHYGGAFYTILETPVVRNSILWGNTAEKGAAIIGTASFAETIVEGGCPVGVSCSHVRSDDPLLGAPGVYGGAVSTIPILTGSPAIDQVTDFCPATDARGIARPQGVACDLGAYETRGLALALVSGNNQAVEVYQPYTATLVVSATNIEGHAVNGAVATFASPSTGAGTAPISKTATFAGGQAAVNVTANGYPGVYSVTVRAPGSAPVVFTLDNLDTPVAGLQASHSGSAPVGYAVTFTATVQGGTSIVYTWEFGDGATANTTDNVLTHAYALAGNYAVTVTAANELASARLYLALPIYDVELAGLTATSNGPTALGQSTQFYATTQAGTGLAYTWSFGDGATATGQSPIHTYAAPGLYTVTLQATNGTSTGSTQTTVLVEQALANVGLLPQGTIIGEVGRAVSFSVEVGAGLPTTVAWHFGDEPAQVGAAAAEAGSTPWTSIEHVYAAPGAYHVTVHVANSVSAYDISNVVEIRDVPIVGASITWDGQPDVQAPLLFTAHRVEGTSISCIWDFDDSTPPVTGCEVEHAYATDGLFTIKLWMVNSIGVIVTRSNIEIIDLTPDPTTDNFLYLPSVRN